MKIEADRDVCIGAGMCVMTAEEVFDQDDDGSSSSWRSRCRGARRRGRAGRGERPSGALRRIDD